MSILLPCTDVLLRAAATQRPSRRTLKAQKLHPAVEKEIAILLVKEIEFELRIE